MDQHDFHDVLQSQQLLSLNSKIAALQSATHAAEARRAQEKAAKDRVFAAFEEFQLIQKNLHKFPLWAALRLIALHHDLQGHLPYSALAPLKAHVATDESTFPFSAVSFGPLEQTDLEALEYKALLSKLKTGIPEALDEVFNGHAEVKSDALTGVMGCLGAAHLAELEADACLRIAKPKLNPAAMAFLCVFLCLIFLPITVGLINVGLINAGLIHVGLTNSQNGALLAVLTGSVATGIFFLKRHLNRNRAETKKTYDRWITTGANKLREAIALVKGGPPSPPPAPPPLRQLPAPTVTASPPPDQAPKPRRTEPTALCSNCQQKIVFPIAMAGQVVACPSCGAQTSLDDASDALS